jgi:hypothetical protein
LLPLEQPRTLARALGGFVDELLLAGTL